MNAKLSARGITVPYAQSLGMSVKEGRFSAGLAIDRHTHGTGYLCWTLAGSALDTIDKRDYDAAPGYAYYVPPQTPHANVFGTAGARCLLIELDAPALEFLDDARLDSRNPWARFGGESVWNGLAMYARLRCGTASSLDVEELVLRAFDRRPMAVAKRVNPPAWLSRTREMLEVALERPPRLATLAREADVHPIHLARAFRTYIGCSPGEYVQSRRIAQACRLLLDSKIPLARIALGLGYYDQSHLTRAFTSRVGVSPGTYRAAVNPTRTERSQPELTAS
jgi:AraC family transcriptional regulator